MRAGVYNVYVCACGVCVCLHMCVHAYVCVCVRGYCCHVCVCVSMCGIIVTV